MSADPVAPVTEATSVPAQASQKDQEIGHKVYAGNLAPETTEEGLRAFFAPVASDILSVQVLRSARQINYGFVAVSTLAAAEKAVAELNKKPIGDREVTVELARPAEEKRERRAKRRVGRRGGKAPPGEVTEAEANGEAAPADGAAADPEVKTTKPKRAKKPRKKTPKATVANGEANGETAAVEGDATTAAAAPATGEKSEKKTRPKRERKPRVPRAEGEDPTGEPSKTTLFVANLSYSVDDTMLAEVFTAEGINVVSARVVRRPYGTPRRSKGYGFVDVGNEEEQKKALEKLVEKEVAGRVIAVKVAVNAHKELESADGGVAAEVGREQTPEVAVIAS